ncbi:MAG: hypothetical protein FJY97_13320 [candidate division Zixibacteria bacterium]|nr:hypothetical protein [candidate division Zixibacteria bacterium]
MDPRGDFKAEITHELFTGEQVGRHDTVGGRGLISSYDGTPDGQRFVVVQNTSAGTASTITVVRNWMAEFRKK